MITVAKRAGVTAVLGIAGYFLVPIIGLATPALYWDGDGPAFAETALGNVFFGTMHLSLLVGAVAAVVAAVTGLVALVRRRSGTTARTG